MVLPDPDRCNGWGLLFTGYTWLRFSYGLGYSYITLIYKAVTLVYGSLQVLYITLPLYGRYSYFTGYEFDLIEYDKDEYIKIQAEKNADLENEITQAQIAMCEIYEMMG